MRNKHVIAYFSMEIYLTEVLKNYAGGLGILAGDLLRAAADHDLPLIGVTLLNDWGYFEQKINSQGGQETFALRSDLSCLKKLSAEIKVMIGTEEVTVGAWEYLLTSETGFIVPVYLLDTNLAVNKQEYRGLTGRLYDGDRKNRLKQEIILGRGGVKMLAALGYEIDKYHLNEGHSALAALELFNNSPLSGDQEKIVDIKKRCLFTTHTSVDGAHNIFPEELVVNYQSDWPRQLTALVRKKKIDLTEFGVYFSDHVNAVSLSHQRVVARIFPDREISYVTNGVHSTTWTAPEFQALYDRYLPGWRQKNILLEGAREIPISEIYVAHQQAKRRLLAYIKKDLGLDWSEDVLTIVFARRMVNYKRPGLLFSDIVRLLTIQDKEGKIQVVLAGKAHPQDEDGRKLIEDIYAAKNKYSGRLEICFLTNYEVPLAKLLVAGADLWLNTPLLGNEASGTSGMKAAHNGVPQLSTGDGWWEEGYLPGLTGWLIAESTKDKERAVNQAEADSLYERLAKDVLPMYYNNQDKWRELMRSTISSNAWRFSAERTIGQYAVIYDLEKKV